MDNGIIPDVQGRPLPQPQHHYRGDRMDMDTYHLEDHTALDLGEGKRCYWVEHIKVRIKRFFLRRVWGLHMGTSVFENLYPYSPNIIEWQSPRHPPVNFLLYINPCRVNIGAKPIHRSTELNGNRTGLSEFQVLNTGGARCYLRQ